MNFTCVTTPAREPALTSDRVDMVIATFTYTPTARRGSTSRVRTTRQPGACSCRTARRTTTCRARGGRRSATTTGSIYDRWVKNCFKDTKGPRTDSLTNALLEFRNGRADALMLDDTVLLGIATRTHVKLTDDRFLALPYGIGIRQGNTALKRWIDSAARTS